MKMKISLLILSILCAFSCMSSDAVKGNGTIVTKTIPVENFTEVDLGSDIEAKQFGNPFSSKDFPVFNYTQNSGTASLKITMDENLFDHLAITQKDGKLKIRGKNGKIRPSQLTIYGTSQDLRKVLINGCMDFIAGTSVNLNKAYLSISGVGNVKLSALTCDDFKCDLSGVGKLYLTGKIKEGDFNVSGVGRVYAFDCPVEHLKCDVSGVGSMEVNATQSIEANTSGVGNIKYKGTPEEVNQSTSGIGKVKHVD